MAGYTEDDMKANIRTHVPDFDMASEIMSRVSLSRVLLDALKETRMAVNQGIVVLDEFTLAVVNIHAYTAWDGSYVSPPGSSF